MRTIFVAAFLFAVFAFNTQAKDFKGIITYKISYEFSEEMKAQMQGMESMFPKVMTYYISGNMAKIVISSPMGGNNINIIDGNNKVVYTLMDMMGNKFYFKKSSEEIDEELAKESDPEIKYLDETKEIAGYECKKASITVENDGEASTFNIYYSPELGNKSLNFDNSLFKEIDGTLMEFEMNERGVVMRFEAVSVEKKKLKESDFEIPEDYKETTPEELQQNFGGGM